jgi:SAM-dependent methyltransferase
MSKTSGLAKEYVSSPAQVPATAWHKMRRALLAPVLAPLYAVMAMRAGAPGLQFRAQCTTLAARYLIRTLPRTSPRTLYELLFWPMDSTRYFEMDFVWRRCLSGPASRYLDVSSPRLLPLALVLRRPTLRACLLNPDESDLAVTRALAAALRLEDRCTAEPRLIEETQLQASTFDLITSVSVIEHIPDDQRALRHIWRLLQTGGRLLVTVPCAARATDQYTDRNPFGLLRPDEAGYVFWQRYYDEGLLHERIFPITGRPRLMTVYGERQHGSFRANARKRLSNPSYPLWREPYMMSQDYTYFSRVSDLPGEGVVAMEFVKW